MRSLMCLLFLVIFCSVQMTSSANLAIAVANSKCCEGFSKVKIPVNKVVSYCWTSSICPIRAIVFQTIAGKEFCIDPETPWVKSHIETVDKRTMTTESNAKSTTNATQTSATESTSAALRTATTAKTQSCTV
ncbi:C-C motif chemokine 13-like isoform X1 [Carassius auratus]|uniref:C-C motif chemokine 13-like isoform X1 n=1 Tax=Carassius auratus TaxID=7957 RepID=A0A6P6NF58_CARAU|nr:C-C motif chemokine 13-like isoform X1 [Carassius auratus]